MMHQQKMSHQVQQIVRVNFIYINSNRFIYSLNLKEAAHMVTSKSYTPMEVHQDHDVNIIPDEKIEDVTISNADQIKNGVLYKSNTTDEKIPSKLNLHNLSAVEKESSIILNNDTQPKVAVEDKYNEGYRVARDVDIEQRDVETQVFERRIRKERCGCSINNKLSNCNARNYKERSHVGFELDINDNYNDDEGYNTARSPKSIGISTNVENITSKDNFSLKKPNSSVMKVSEPSQSSLPKFSLPPSTNYPDSTPEKITSEDSEIVIPTINIDTADMNKNLIDVQKMANSMQNQLALMNRLKSKYMSNINNNGKSGNDSVKQTNKVHVETTYCDELTPGLFTTPGKLQSRDKSNKQQLSKNNYPSDDEHHMPIRHRNVTENAISDKKLGNSDTEETNRRSESPRNRIKANENSARASSSRPVNAETQSSQTQVEAGTSYSYVDAIQSSPRYRRQNKRQSSESSQSPNKNRSTRSKVHDVNTKSPAKSFLGSSSSYEQVNDESSFRHKKSKNNAITQIPKRQYQSRSRPSTRERATPKSQSPVARSTTPTYIRNRYNEKFEC
ncbi:hypothetical protein PV327_006338 [Microctonus hyperodae]|uniref:Uncharacterized protein n=1 Tax=Microctonus hyperodae TaxID=165561 RepID=A0AA39F469_MICHY|nr:hypothetical protein PV327_006338 [Microctonus hyperodae]